MASSALGNCYRTDSSSTCNQSTDLSWGDVATDSRHTPTLLRMHLKRSKCDQFGEDVGVFVGRTRNKLCPVAAMLTYLAVRGDAPHSLFIDRQQQPLTKSSFAIRIRRILESPGYLDANFAGHSFKIGAATTAAQRGVEDSVIQALGR